MAQLAPVQVSNPAPRRVKARRKGKAETMAAKKRRKRARKSGTKARKAGTRKRRRKAAGASAAPKRRRRLKRSTRSRVRLSPARRRARARKRTSKRNPLSAIMNPRRHHKRGRRRSRRNPGIPSWALAGLAGLAGLAAYAITGAGSFALTQRIDPSMATLERNRYIAGGLAAAAGLGVAIFASPVIGAGLLGGGLVALAGTDLYLAIGKVIDKAPTAPAAARQVKGVFEGDSQQLGGVFSGGSQQLGIGGIYQGGSQQLGELDQWQPAYAAQNRY